MCEIVTLGRLFFVFLSLMRIATGRSVGPIVAVNGSNDSYSIQKSDTPFKFYS